VTNLLRHRQLIGWAAPLASSGQQWRGTPSLAPHPRRIHVGKFPGQKVDQKSRTPSGQAALVPHIENVRPGECQGWGHLSLRASFEAPLRLPIYVNGAVGVWSRQGRTITAVAGVLCIANLTIDGKEVDIGGSTKISSALDDSFGKISGNILCY
jgi:hypothetical protein